MRKWLVVAIFMSVAPAAAESVPSCDERHDGVAACMAGRVCVCHYVPKDAVRPAHYSWDCGITRPVCEIPPADLPPAAMAPGARPANPVSPANPADVSIHVRPPRDAAGGQQHHDGRHKGKSAIDGKKAPAKPASPPAASSDVVGGAVKAEAASKKNTQPAGAVPKQ